MQLKDHVFLVTGAASGLGAAVARLVAQEGGSVLIADLNRDAGEAIAAELGHSARFAATDVTSEADATAAIALALASFGHLHALVNCAGIAPAEKILGRDPPHRLETSKRRIGEPGHRRDQAGEHRFDGRIAEVALVEGPAQCPVRPL